MILRAQIPVDRRLTGSGVNGGVVLSDVVRKEIVELRKGMDLPGIDHREPAAADGAEVPFDLLSECSDKSAYTKDIFIRIFFKRPHKQLVSTK